MKKKIKITATLLVLTSAMLLGACNEGGSPVVPQDKELNLYLDKEDLNLSIGDKTKLFVSNSYNDDSLSITWTSTNPLVASVNERGIVEAIRDGETYIIAKHDALSAACKVTVSGGYYVPSLHFENEISEEEAITKGDSLNLSTYVLFNNLKFTDVSVNYEISNPLAGQMNGNYFEASGEAGTSTDITLKASWRNFLTPTLTKVIHVEIIPIGEVAINSGLLSEVHLFTVDNVLGHDYKHTQVIDSIVGKYNGEEKNVINVELINNESFDNPLVPAAGLEFDLGTGKGKITGLREGAAKLKVTLEGGYSQTFEIGVDLPYYVMEESVKNFSALDGKYFDITSDSFKSLGELFPVGDSTIVKAYQGDKKLTVSGDKVLDINLDNPQAMKEATVVIYNSSMSVELRLECYTKVVTTIDDFYDIIGTDGSGKTITGFYYLAKDIDALEHPISLNPTLNKWNTFAGIFEGNGHVIKASLIREAKHKWGLFGSCLNGIVRNVAFYNCKAQAADAGFIAQVANTANNLLSNVYLNVTVETAGRRNTPVVGAFASTYGLLRIKQTIIDIPNKLVSDYDNNHYYDGALGIHKVKEGSDSYIVSTSEIGRRYINDGDKDARAANNMKSYNYKADMDNDTAFIATGGVQHLIDPNMLLRVNDYEALKNAGRSFANFSQTYWDLTLGYPRFKGTF